MSNPYAAALALGGAIPIVWTVGCLLLYRRLDSIGVLAIVGFGTELLVTVLTGGNPLALKVREAPLTSAFGICCLV